MACFNIWRYLPRFAGPGPEILEGGIRGAVGGIPVRMATVKRDGIEASGAAWSEAEEEAFKAPIREQYERQGHPYYASARLWDDGILDPAETRSVLGRLIALAPMPEGPARAPVFRM